MKDGQRVRVELSSADYEVLIGPLARRQVGAVLGPLARGRQVAVITDDIVGPLHADEVGRSLADSGFHVHVHTIPSGERSKSWARAGEVVEWLAACGLERTDTVIALGGGVVGDLAGFCAAVFLRGVGFVQMPTTLLAQVDSSVGGKTGVDLTAGKNLAGAFKQPLAVIADTAVLNTLPETEWRSGLGEVAKSAVLDGEEFLTWLESNAAKLLARDTWIASEAVSRCVAFKARVVGADEQEAGLRESLNLGHTLGHAIEKAAGYGTIPHGIAVADGMRFAAGLAVAVRRADSAFAERIGLLLDALGLPSSADMPPVDALRLAMSSDKKVRDGHVRFVLPLAPGVHVVESVDEGVLEAQLEAFVR